MRYSWIVPVVIVAFLLIAVGYWGYGQYEERQQLQVYLGNQYNESFFKLVDRVEDVTALCGKGVVSTGQAQFVSICSDIWKNAMEAQESLNNLPISNATLVDTSKFLTQLGDYALSLAKANLKERTVSDEQKDKLQSLRAQAANLSEALHNIEGSVTDGHVKWWDMVKKTGDTLEAEDNQLLSNNFQNMMQQNEPFPTLIYDGPFSDHIDQEEPKGLTGETIGIERARQIATEFPDYPGNPNQVVKDLPDVEGKIPAFQFSVQPEDDNQNHTTIDVSKKGGHVLMYLNPRNVGEGKTSRIAAMDKGGEFLKTRKYPDMVPTYSWIEDNVLTISYAYKQDDVIIYPDLIKLKIAMDNGQVIGFEGLGFIMSHHQRDLPEPEVTEEEIRSFLDAKYTIESVRLALIPTPGLKENLTWEARIRYQEETYLMYYDVQTGEEVNILKVIDTPNGTFAE